MATITSGIKYKSTNKRIALHGYDNCTSGKNASKIWILSEYFSVQWKYGSDFCEQLTETIEINLPQKWL